jgi:hypothetical protein
MPATASQRKLITEAIVTALRAITGAEYHYPVLNAACVDADPTVNLLTVNGADLPRYVVECTPDGEREFFPAMQLRDFVQFNVHVRKDAASAEAHARMETWENLGADIEKALTVDVTLGGLVYDVRVAQPRPFVGVGSAIVIVVNPVRVSLHRTYGEP